MLFRIPAIFLRDIEDHEFHVASIDNLAWEIIVRRCKYPVYMCSSGLKEELGHRCFDEMIDVIQIMCDGAIKSPCCNQRIEWNFRSRGGINSYFSSLNSSKMKYSCHFKLKTFCKRNSTGLGDGSIIDWDGNYRYAVTEYETISNFINLQIANRSIARLLRS